MSTPLQKRYPRIEPRRSFQPGQRTCLRCGKPFQSWDVRLNKICGAHTRGKPYAGIDEESTSAVPRGRG
jgi:hypothetical protein